MSHDSRFRHADFHVSCLGPSARSEQNNPLLDGFYPTHFDDNRGIFNFNGEVVYSGQRITAMAALGVNATAGFPAQVAPRVGASLAVTKRAIVKASWGLAYKVPSFYSVSDPVVGNPSLLPEKMMGLDAGIQRSFGEKLTLSATYYCNRFTDLIDFGAELFKLVNRTSVRTQGVETSAAYAFARYLRVSAIRTVSTYADCTYKGLAERGDSNPRYSF